MEFTEKDNKKEDFGFTISFDEQDSALHDASDKELLAELEQRGADSVYLAIRELQKTYDRMKLDGIRSSYET